MARAIEGNISRDGRHENYPWDQWANGEQWEAVRGVDFDCDISAFRNSIYKVASRRGLKASCILAGETVIRFQFRNRK